MCVFPQINIKDNQIHELVNKVTKLFEENEKLRNDKAILVENYNSLYEKIDTRKTNILSETKVDNRSYVAERLETENKEMKNDMKMLKILVFRLNKHIEHYQVGFELSVFHALIRQSPEITYC